MANSIFIGAKMKDNKLVIHSLPQEIQNLLEIENAPELLKRHLRIVYTTALALLHEIDEQWGNLDIDRTAVLFGAGTHDIGKVIEKEELYLKGKKHEVVGKLLLLKKGFKKDLARFAQTHGNWEKESIEIEDLIVILADKIWKGKRVFEIEEKFSLMIAEKAQLDYWTVNQKLDEIFERILLLADYRLNWQKGNC